MHGLSGAWNTNRTCKCCEKCRCGTAGSARSGSAQSVGGTEHR